MQNKVIYHQEMCFYILLQTAGDFKKQRFQCIYFFIKINLTSDRGNRTSIALISAGSLMPEYPYMINGSGSRLGIQAKFP